MKKILESKFVLVVIVVLLTLTVDILADTIITSESVSYSNNKTNETTVNGAIKNINDEFANYNKQITSEKYLDSEGNSLGYTYRDVLDELAQVTASTICIDEDDDELEIRYINELVSESGVKEGTVIPIDDNIEVKPLSLELYGDTKQDGTPTPDSPVDI